MLRKYYNRCPSGKFAVRVCCYATCHADVHDKSARKNKEFKEVRASGEDHYVGVQ